MEHYKKFDHINSKTIVNYGNLNRELVSWIKPSAGTVPLTVLCYGITFPDPEYKIERQNSECFVLEYIAEGEGSLIKNGIPYKVQRNDAYLLTPCSSNKYYPDPTNPYKKYWVNFEGDVFFDIVQAYGLDKQTVFGNIDLTRRFEELFELDKISDENDAICYKASEIIFGMLMDIAATNHETKKVSELARNIKITLDKSVCKNFSVENLAKDLFVSASQITREFKKYYKQTPYEYLLDRRLETAKTLLSATANSASKIADYLCFTDSHHFARFFKSRTGYTPKQYRDKYAPPPRLTRDCSRWKIRRFITEMRRYRNKANETLSEKSYAYHVFHSVGRAV